MQISIKDKEEWVNRVGELSIAEKYIWDMPWAYHPKDKKLEVFSKDSFVQELIYEMVLQTEEILVGKYDELSSDLNEKIALFHQDSIQVNLMGNSIKVEVIAFFDMNHGLISGIARFSEDALNYEFIREYIQYKKNLDSVVQENEQLRLLAYKDQLTQLYNRTFMEEQLNMQIEQVGRYGKDVSLILFDIDDFKVINDVYGHCLGDKVLKELSSRIKSHVRASDIVARWGGEEFLILLPETDVKVAEGIANKLCHLIGNHVFDCVGHVYISLGVTQLNTSDSFRTVLKRVDKALYHAKQHGKNQSVCFLNDDDIPFSTMIVSWHHSWECGHSIIDAQHKNLVDYANRIFKAMSEKQDVSSVIYLLSKMVQKTKHHFESEELILAQLGYSSFLHHKELHESLVVKAMNLHRDVTELQSYQSTYVSYIIEDVILKHMLHEDAKFYSLVK